MTTSTIGISSICESWALIDTNEGIMREIRERYSFRAQNYMFDKRYKMGFWNGWIHIFDFKNSRLPKGLVPDLIKWALYSKYSISLGEGFSHFTKEIKYVGDSLPLPFEPRSYQKEAVVRCLEKKRQIILSPTASGKSFIIYLTTLSFLKNDPSKKILVIVPTVSLVTQMVGDFVNYSSKNELDMEKICHKIYSGQEKSSNKPIVVSTWQSIYKMPKSWFEQFGTVICDEVHTATADSISSIMKKADKAENRIGLTGTLTDSKMNELALIGHFGPVHKMITTAELMESGMISQLKINAIILKHPSGIPLMPYTDELDYIVTNKARNEFIVKLVKNLKGNTLVLFQFVEKHGRVLEAMMKEAGLNVMFVYGGTDAEDRENVRKIMEQRDGVVALASSQIFSTGVSINRLHNVILASPSKSKIRILQSIGRSLRKHENKTVANLYDIADDIMVGSKPNHTLNHFTERYKIYLAEKFKIDIVRIPL